MTVRPLDETTIRQIAAGEVIERPASAVKELVENSFDAGASRIDVAVDAGGKARIRVVDDGTGMSREAVRLAVEEHTTSKIDGAADLESISTLGFRGEALYAIGAVSRLTITTRPQTSEQGTRLSVDHGAVTDVEPVGRPVGTTVEVTDLFGETPARRKFLKTDATEFDHVSRVVGRYALANPGVAVSLHHGDHEVFATTGQGDLRGAILALYGREVAEAMTPVEADRVNGVVSHPETNRADRAYLSTFVNGRYVRSSSLRNAILEAYGRQLDSDRYPFAVVFCEVPADAVDVNVHPRKLEVRFDDEEAVTESVRTAVRDALLEAGIVRSSAPRGRSAPAETDLPGTPGSATASPVDATATTDSSGPEANSTDPSDAAAVTSADESTPGLDASASPAEPSPVGQPGSIANAEASSSGRGGRLRVDATQTTLAGEATTDRFTFDRLPGMTVLGQLHDTYVVGETDRGLVLLDQHAADERINYERLRDRLDRRASQALAAPVAVELTAREAARYPPFEGALEELGFRADRLDDRTVEVTAVPAVFSTALEPDRLRDVLSSAIERGADGGVSSIVDAILADLACHPSITGHTSLTDGSIRDLLRALDACENPFACPHGRPVIVEIDADELAGRFERDYPGHAGRRAE